MKPLDPRLLRYASTARPFILGCAVLGVATAALVLAQADLLATTISRAFLDGAGLATLTVPIGLLTVTVLGRATVAWLTEAAAHRASASVLAQLRTAVIDHVLRTGPRRQAGRSPADVATLATRGVDRLDGYFARYLPQLLIAALVPAVVGVRILTADWIAAVIVGVTVPLIPVFMILIGLYTRRNVQQQWRTLSVLGNHFLDLLAGLAVLTAFGRARAQRRSLREITERYRVQTMRTLRVAFLSALVLELLASLSVALVAVSVGLRLVSGSLDLHTALVVLILAPEVYWPLRALGARFHDSAEGMAAADEIFALLDDDPPPAGQGRVPAPDPSRVPLRLCGVTVRGRSGPVLDNFTLRVEPGEVVGVSGPSGAGKSTLLDLLLAWYPPDCGAVFVDGVDLADLDRDAWHRRIAWVPQRPRLLAGTVADNIRLGSPEATDGDVASAADRAALDIPLDTQIGELGAGLSTGQQRRVALARALLLDRPLLLLDEPTEGVDADTETAILRQLPAMLECRTAVIVTHRDSVLDACTRVVRLPGPTTPCPSLDRSQHPSPRPQQAPSVTPTPADVSVRTKPTTWQWLLAAVGPHRLLLTLACLAGAASLASGVALTATSAWLIASAALHPPILTLMVAIVAVRAFGLAKGSLRYIERLLSHDIALRALADLRVRIWTALVRIGPAVTDRIRRGDLLNRLVSDVDSQQDVLVRAVVPAAAAALVATGTTAAIGVLLPGAGVVIGVGLCCAGVLAPALSLLASRNAERHTTTLRADVVAGTVELLQAAPDLIAFGAGARRHTALRHTDATLTTALRASAAARGLGAGVGALAIGATMIGCLVLGIAALRTGQLSGPELAVLALTPLATGELVAGLPEAAQRLLGARHSARRLAELEATRAPNTEPVTPKDVTSAQQLAADQLSVRWPDATTDAVSDLNLTIGAQRRILLTGPSGAGKSTALAALMRYLDPSAGQIRLDGMDTRAYLPDTLRTHLGWCGPDTHLFDSTLRENLLLARTAATDAALHTCLERAHLGRWLDSLPDGLDTTLGTHGTPVSGGEQQRLGIARVLLADRPILLLDEPTAHLDSQTATDVATELLALTADHAALIVTHRPTDFPDLPVVTLRAPACAAVIPQDAALG